MVVALVAWPVLAMAPTQNSDIIRPMDNYIVSYYVPYVPTKPQGYSPYSCVSYAKYRRPDQDFIWIAPRYVEAYNLEPKAGLLVITNEGKWGHVGVIEEVTEDAIIIREANYVSGLVTTREIPLDSPVIRGYR